MIFPKAALVTLLLLLCSIAVFASPKKPVAKTEKHSVETLSRQADALRGQQDYAAARDLYSRALKLSPKDSSLWNKRGISELRLREYTTALHDFSEALKFDRKNAEAANNLGVIHYIRKDYRRAITSYKKAIAIQDSASFHSNLGAAYFENDEISKGIDEYIRALQLDPEVLERTSADGVSAHVGRPADRAHYSFLMARLYAKLGDFEHTIRSLRVAKENGSTEVGAIYTDADFTAIRQDPRFQEIAAEFPVSQ